MAYRTCEVDGCRRKHDARGMCKMHYKRQFREGWSDGDTESRRCEQCGATFEARIEKTRPTSGRFCGQACYHASRVVPKLRKLVIKDCAGCGEAFVARHHTRQTFCSASCRPPKPSRYDPRPPRSVTCEMCGAVTMARQGPKRFCSSDCYHKSESFKEANRRDRRRRRAARRGGRHERYTLAEIAQRDSWKCGICGKRVGQNFDPNHGRAPTIDHIVPIADGGDDVKVNVQLAHRSCNSKKSHTGPGQLRLVG